MICEMYFRGALPTVVSPMPDSKMWFKMPSCLRLCPINWSLLFLIIFIIILSPPILLDTSSLHWLFCLASLFSTSFCNTTSQMLLFFFSLLHVWSTLYIYTGLYSKHTFSKDFSLLPS
uniref:Uncharacterized protein n=1 Tax=Cacopsylla melanoneura TaxID=428564 RepID=A0A8D8X8K6_9HEMI